MAQLYNKVIRGTFAMTVNNPNPEAMIRWVDYLFSEQGGTESRYGYENVHWEWVNDEHTSFRKIIPDGMNGEEYRGGQITPDCGTSIPNIASVIFQALEYNENPPYTSRLVEQSESLSPYLKAPFPQTYYSAKQNEDIAALSTDLNTYVSQMRARFITGEEPLTENSWNTYVDTLKRMNVERYIEIYQEIYDGLSK